MRPPSPYPPGSIEKLQALLAGARSAPEYRRIQAVLMRATTHATPAGIAATTGLSVNTVRLLQSRFLRHGPSSLLGRAPRVPPAPVKTKRRSTAADGASAFPPAASAEVPPVEKPARSRVTLRELAAAAGVSRTTVSLALRGDLSLPPRTRARIRKLAGNLGYRPDPEVHQLMEAVRARRRSRRPNTIAYLTAHEERYAWKNHPTHLAYHEGAARRAEECGYHLEEFWLREKGMTERRLSDVIRNRGIDGVIVSPLPTAQLLFQDFKWDWFSAVELGYSLPSPALCRACNHQFQSIQLLVQQLHLQGYRRIGFAMEEDQDNRVKHNWRGGYLSAPALYAHWPDIPFLLHADWTRDRFVRWLDRHRPDVVLTAGPEVARWCQELGLRTPADLGLANVDLTPAMRGQTGINQNSPQVGAAGVDLVISLMRSNERGLPGTPRILMVQGEFVAGNTTRPGSPVESGKPL